MEMTSMISLGTNHLAEGGAVSASPNSQGINGLSGIDNLLSSSLSLAISSSSSSDISGSSGSNNGADAALAGLLYQMCQYAAERILTDNPSANNPIDAASSVNSISSITT
jgi:hypothetical protein